MVRIMPMPKFRGSSRVRLTVSNAKTVRLPIAGDAPPLLPWPLAAVGGGVATALAGALLVAGVMLLAWLSAIAVPVPTLLGFAAQVWLLGNGGELLIGPDRLSLVPLGLTLCFGAMCSSTGRFAFRQGQQSRPAQQDPAQRTRLAVQSALQVAAGYTAFAVLIAWSVQGSSGVLRAGLGAFAVSLVGSLIGGLAAAGLRPWEGLPHWVRFGLRGAGVGLLALVVLAAVVLAGEVAGAEPQVGTLEEALGLDSGGVVVWSLVTLAFLPDLLAWTLSWLLGAGFTVGSGSLVSVSGTKLGMLPNLPILGALPEPGAADPWQQLWLLSGVLVGALAGVVAVRGHRTSLVGALASGGAAGGILGLGYTLWAILSRGDLGHLRLVALGPRILETLLISLPLLLLGAVVGAVVTWFLRRFRSAG